MAGLLSGLADLGLGNLENIDIYEEPEKPEVKKKATEEKVVELQEKDFIYDKSWECPVCDNKFTSKTVKTGRVRMLGMEKDLRPLHEGIDVQKYDVVLCPHCGYAALTRYFPHMTSVQAKLIKEQISQKVHLHEYKDETYSYLEAVERYKLALANAVVKHGKNSEKAYICLKMGWLLRGYAEALETDENATEEELTEVRAQEENDILNAYKGFTDALQTESIPMCGMDETTIDYLMAALGVRFKEYERASRLVAKIITSPSANARTKDKARELKEELLTELRKNK
ncbi:MAG: DUF2225 domain-containing protein [Lachnospiraceae bacterium]|nr:DUF2225 domain-containing protein [Lachnospiraceae bacterium]